MKLFRACDCWTVVCPHNPPSNEDDFLEQIEKARQLIRESAGCPEHFYHPDYGWCMRDGKLTEVGKKFVADFHKGQLQKSSRIVLKKGIIKSAGEAVFLYELETNIFRIAWAHLKNAFKIGSARRR